jgi:hypothetical protein
MSNQSNPSQPAQKEEKITLTETFADVKEMYNYKNASFYGGKFYYSCNNVVYVVDPYKRDRGTVWKSFPSEVEFFGFSKDGKKYFVSMRDYSQKIVDIKTGSIVNLPEHKNCIECMIEYGDDEIICVSEDRIIRYKQSTGEVVLCYSKMEGDSGTLYPSAILDKVNDTLVVTAWRHVWIFCNKTGKGVSTGVRAHQTSVAFVDASTILVAGDKRLCFYDHKEKKIKAEYPIEDYEVYHAEVSPGGRYVLFSGGGMTYFYVFDLQTQKIVTKALTNSDGIDRFALSDDWDRVCLTGHNCGYHGRVSVLKITPALKKY